MAGKSDDIFDSIFESLFKGIGLIFECFFLGFYELRKKAATVVFVISLLGSAGILIAFYHFGMGRKLYALIIAVLPVVVLMVLGGMHKQKQAYYSKIFMDANFKGKDGRVPLFLNSKELDNKTEVLFKSNIPLSQWEKNKELLQTAFDIQILSVEQMQSNKIIRMEYVPAGFDLPKKLPWKEEFLSKKLSEIVLGVSMYGQLKFDFNDIAHWIVAGAPGVGKSVLVRLITYQCFLKGFKVYIMDFKRGMEFGKIYDNFSEVVRDKKRAAEVLQEINQECQQRCDLIRELGLKNIDEYNTLHPDEPMQRVVIIIDELAILLKAGRNKEDKENTAISTSCLEDLAIIGRAPGFNLVLGIQRPDAETVTGQIKSNVLGRICGYFTDVAPSQIVLITKTKYRGKQFTARWGVEWRFIAILFYITPYYTMKAG